MTNTPSLPSGGEKQADQVEAVARALYEHWKHNAMPIGRWIDQDRRFRQHFEDAARAALSASKPLVVEECARVADAFAERMACASEKPHPITGKKNRIAPMKKDAAITIAKAIRALKESPSEGSGG